MNGVLTNERALAGALVEDQVNWRNASVAECSHAKLDVYTAPKPDLLGKWRRKMMRELKRDSAYKSWHPAQKRKMRHLMMRHMNPQNGFMMRQDKFAKELGVRREKVNNFLRQAVERELLTAPRGSDGLRAGWRGANVYFVHPRILEAAQQGAHCPAHRGAQLEVSRRKFYKGSSAYAEADRCIEEEPKPKFPAFALNAPAEGQEQVQEPSLDEEPAGPVLKNEGLSLDLAPSVLGEKPEAAEIRRPSTPDLNPQSKAVLELGTSTEIAACNNAYVNLDDIPF